MNHLLRLILPFHDDLVSKCKQLLKASKESDESMIATEIKPCATIGFSQVLNKDLDRQILLDFQDCIEDETKRKHEYFEIGYCSSTILPQSKIVLEQATTLLFSCFEKEDHPKITELLQQASTRVLFLYFNHLRCY